jgi:hypothetical protein
MQPVYAVNSAKITEPGTTSALQHRPKRRNPIKGVLFEAMQLLSNYFLGERWFLIKSLALLGCCTKLIPQYLNIFSSVTEPILSQSAQ